MQSESMKISDEMGNAEGGSQSSEELGKKQFSLLPANPGLIFNCIITVF